MASSSRQGRWGRYFLSALLYGGFATGAVAESAGNPPSNVGRVALVDGEVSFRAAPEQPWGTGLANLPLIAGSSLLTRPSGRAVLELAAARFWLDGSSEIDIERFDDHATLITLPHGRVDISLGGLRPGDSYVVETPAGPVALEAAGLYRVIAGDQNIAPSVAVFAGRADFSSGGGTQTIEGGQEAFAAGSPSLFGPAVEDRFDRWVDARSSRDNGGFASQYVPPGISGTDDLDGYGQWRDVPDYGTVWVPTQVPINWAPYRDGRWQWIDPWGWTWVDNAPWGFAPFHYGRWIKLGGWWSWVPGPRDSRPVYSPALVAFDGDPETNADRRGPGVDWLPLGPKEIYRPSWEGTAGNSMNHHSVTIINRDPVSNAQPARNRLWPTNPGAELHGTFYPVRVRIPDAPPQNGHLERHEMTSPLPPRHIPIGAVFQGGVVRPVPVTQMPRQNFGIVGAIGAPPAPIRSMPPIGGGIQPLRPVAPIAPLRPIAPLAPSAQPPQRQ